jgi:hypothetical protein
MEKFELWDWPKKWEIVKGHPTVIDPNAPQMSNITCKYCGRVFNTVGSKMTHETASQKTNNSCRWNTNITEEQKLTVKFVPPIDDAKKQEIANWYFNTKNNPYTTNQFALGQYNKLLTTKKDDVSAGIAVGNPAGNAVVGDFFYGIFTDKPVESVSASKNTGLPSGWAGTLGKVDLASTAHPRVFSNTLEARRAAAETKRRRTAAKARAAAAAKARRTVEQAAVWDEPLYDPDMLDIPEYPSVFNGGIVGSTRPRGDSFELLSVKRAKRAGRRNTRKTRKKTRKTRKKKRKKRRRTRKKKRKGR